MSSGNEFAGEGEIFVCGACGKRSKDLYGDQSINYGWDESCVLNAVLCREDHLVLENNYVKEVKDGGIVRNLPEERKELRKKRLSAQ